MLDGRFVTFVRGLIAHFVKSQNICNFRLLDVIRREEKLVSYLVKVPKGGGVHLLACNIARSKLLAEITTKIKRVKHLPEYCTIFFCFLCLSAKFQIETKIVS